MDIISQQIELSQRNLKCSLPKIAIRGIDNHTDVISHRN
jgi:hypothetical protein